MSAPRTKRQFAGAASDPAQRQITSFFQTTASGNGPSEPSITVVPPPPPAQVQANLISVGMRVRKSVPEGYKTGNLYGGFSLWADSEATAAGGSPKLPPPSAAAAAGGLVRGGRELAPFCGINKVGGLAVQPTVVPELDDVPGLTSSQDSVDFEPASLPTTMLDNNKKKRVYAGVEDEEATPADMAGRENARVMAVPKGRRGMGRKETVGAGAVRVRDQENAGLNVGGTGAGGVDDFEDAEFLDYGAGVTGEMDVEFE